MTPIHVVGIGLEGQASLSSTVQALVAGATLLVGSERHLSYFPDHGAERLCVQDFVAAIAAVHTYLAQTAQPRVVILTSGDPLFFGLGRLLLAELPPEQLTFHPQLSSMQLAFSRLKLPWQDAALLSVHGRSLDELIRVLQQGAAKIAVLTDRHNSPTAIAHLLTALNLFAVYQMWVCENLGGAAERILTVHSLTDLDQVEVAALNVVILARHPPAATPLELSELPILGLADTAFLSFPDRPGLMTKREIRTFAIAELAIQPQQVIWDIGAGTGSVAIEMARLCPTAHIYAIEKTAIGFSLIQQNCQRFQVENITPIHGTAPEALATLPAPDRVFVGGSGGQLPAILALCETQLRPQGRLVLALATLEHFHTALTWLQTQNQLATAETAPKVARQWQYHSLQVQVSRSLPVATLTRWSPLNPVTLVVADLVIPDRLGPNSRSPGRSP